MSFDHNETAIHVSNLSKCYEIYATPRDRLKQFIFPRLQRLLGLPVKYYFRQFWALKECSFEIRRGETVGIIGRNGSGKSTLLQMICGTVSPTGGEVTNHGRLAALLELGAGFNPEFTGRENVMLNAAILGYPQEIILERMDQVLAFSELGDFLEQPVKTYSSGMYARLAFSIAIHVDPKILIVDEALAVGDSRFVAKCMRRIKELQNMGTTILFVSHDISSVRTLCQRAIWLDKGVLVEDGDVFPVTGRYTEFMYQDEIDEDLTNPAEKIQDIEAVDIGEGVSEPESASISNNEFDSRPVTHWGSHKGIILGAGIYDTDGVRRDVLNWGQSFDVIIDVFVPPEISRNHLSIAFSLKDLKGTDLIVSTTHDQLRTFSHDQERLRVTFRMTNALVEGSYLLVAAVENRVYKDIHYYEYLEGAHYFSSMSDERFFGIFQPEIMQTVREL
ncbi:lipopolysaccharide transport system ATP-binding protein [Oxalobacteraceae bacterium GrIS 2.11]